MDRAIEEIYNMFLDLMPIFLVPVFICLFNCILRIIKGIAQGNWEYIEDEKNEREEKSKNQEKKISIDKDLQKYFNYKE